MNVCSMAVWRLCFTVSHVDAVGVCLRAVGARCAGSPRDGLSAQFAATSPLRGVKRLYTGGLANNVILTPFASEG